MGFLLMSDNGKAKPINWVRLELPTPGPSLEKKPRDDLRVLQVQHAASSRGALETLQRDMGRLGKILLE